MIVVADSGATKTDWRIIMEDFSSASFETVGLSPYFNTELDFNDALTHGFPKELNPNEVSKVFSTVPGAEPRSAAAELRATFTPFFLQQKYLLGPMRWVPPMRYFTTIRVS
jgi:hypothetical protein